MVKLVVLHFGSCHKEVPNPDEAKRNVALYGPHREKYWGVTKVEAYLSGYAIAEKGQTVEEATYKMVDNNWPLIQEVADPNGIVLKRIFQIVD